VLFLTLHPGNVWDRLIYQVPILIGAGWGGCWCIFPEIGRLSEGARNAPSLRKLDRVSGVAVISIIGLYAGPIDVENVAAEVLHHPVEFSPLVSLVSAVVILIALFSLGIVAIVSKRMLYPVYLRRREWSLRRRIKAASLVLLIAGSWTMILRQFVLAGLVVFLGGALIRVADRVGGNRVASSTGPQRVSLPPTIRLENEKVIFEKRLAIGKKASDMILGKHGKKILAVCMWGPSADDTEESVSYLDLVAVVKSGQASIPEKKYVYEGIELAISYWPEAAFIARAREIDESWPYYRSRYSNLRVLYEQDGWTRHVRSALVESDKADATEAIRTAALDMVRHLGILRDDLRKGDASDIKADCSELASSSLNLLLLLNHRPYPAGDFWKSISEMPSQPADLRRLFDLAHSDAPASQEEIVAATSKLIDEMLEMVRLRGIAIEKSDLVV